MSAFICAFILLLTSGAEASVKVRRIKVERDQIVMVHTALGIATIVQVPDRPNSVVIGDAEAFKVEYLDQAITVKPLRRGAKSNLYVYTDYQRFNVELTNESKGAADYVVYLETADKLRSEGKPNVVWTKIASRLTSETFSLKVRRVGRSLDGLLLCEFAIESTKRESFKPDWFWLTQSGVSRPIHSLFLSKLEVGPSTPIEGLIQIRKADIDTSRPFRIELRKRKTSFLTIQKVNSWR